MSALPINLPAWFPTLVGMFSELQVDGSKFKLISAQPIKIDSAA